MEALVSGYPQDAKKVSVIGAGRSRECKNTEFVWELKRKKQKQKRQRFVKAKSRGTLS